MVFEFTSEGHRGEIHKLVKYSETNMKQLYNLAFGDLDPDTGDIDDTKVSNNGDSEKVLATVVSTLYAFTDKYPGRIVYATGSSRARNRLYRMGISKYFEEIKSDFEVYGLHDSQWELFCTGKEYEAFLAKRKKQ